MDLGELAPTPSFLAALGGSIEVGSLTALGINTSRRPRMRQMPTLRARDAAALGAALEPALEQAAASNAAAEADDAPLRFDVTG